MQGFYKVYLLFTAGLMMAAGLCCACTISSRTVIPEAGKAIDYKIVPEAQAEDALMEVVSKAKAQRFHIIYRDGDRMYLAVGYGGQISSGYSITVEEICEKDGVIYVHTMLVGPQKDERISSVRTFPYIILEIENVDCEIVFK